METDSGEDDFADAVRAGLTAGTKSLPCRFFYDELGSQIFEEICDLDEYYPTRTEHSILESCAEELTAMFPGRTSLVELGSGSSSKTRVLIESFLARHGALRYMPVDISRSILEESAQSLLDDYEALEVIAIAAEYVHGLRRIKSHDAPSKLIVWLGSSIGNFELGEAATFLTRVRRAMGEHDRLLVGMDLAKNGDVLEAAYDDSKGVTARFNKNILERINRELGGHFDLESFEHRATYSEAAGRVEIRLVSTCAQDVAIDALGVKIAFEKGETIHTENSHKYRGEQIEQLIKAADLELERQWFDDDGLFSVNLLAPACSS